MRICKFFFILAMVIVQQSSALAGVATALSFEDWKRCKIQTAKEDIQHLKQNLDQYQKIDPKSSLIPSTKKELSQSEFNLEVAQNLSVTDYLVLYLSNQHNPTRFKEAAAKLSSEDTAKIIEAYLQSLQAQRQEEVVQTKRNSLLESGNGF